MAQFLDINPLLWELVNPPYSGRYQVTQRLTCSIIIVAILLSTYCRPTENFLPSQETGEAVESPGQSQIGKQTHKSQSVSEQIEICGGAEKVKLQQYGGAA